VIVKELRLAANHNSVRIARTRMSFHICPARAPAELLAKLCGQIQDDQVVAFTRVSAELYTRRPYGPWPLTTVSRMEDSLDLQSVGAHLSLADLYEKVDFTAPAI
jgi:hypothetical protein